MIIGIGRKAMPFAGVGISGVDDIGWLFSRGKVAMTTDERPKRAAYFFLLALQVAGAMTFILRELPEFQQVLQFPGVQPPKDTRSDLIMVVVFRGMQIPFWVRVLFIPVPLQRPNLLLSHIFLFLGRLTFIFGSALFSVVVFRHLPEMGGEADIILAGQRGIIFLACLFALFCSSLEVERLAHAFEATPSG
jgi:hypothetical protein